MGEGPPTGRWFRLNTTWSQSEWVAEMAPAARLAWIELLGYVKAHGFDGRCRAVSAVVFSRMFGIPTAQVKAMLAAAHADGALETDGDDWLITGWKKHQGDPTAAKRMRRYREKNSDGTVTDVTRNDRNVTPTKTETKTETSTTPTSSARAGTRGLDRLRDYLGDHAEAADRMDESTDHGPTWAAGLMGLYGPSGTDEKVYDGLPEPERPTALAIAMDRYAAEAKPYNGRLFRRFLETVSHERQGNGSENGSGHGGTAPGESRGKASGAGGRRGGFVIEE